MSNLVVSLLLAVTQVKEQLAVGNVADVVVRDRSAFSVAVGPSYYGILDGSGVLEGGLEGEVY
jgi:hypothetical protein